MVLNLCQRVFPSIAFSENLYCFTTHKIFQNMKISCSTQQRWIVCDTKNDSQKLTHNHFLFSQKVLHPQKSQNVSIFQQLKLIRNLKRKKMSKMRETRQGPHCVKSVQIRSIFWSVFSRIRTDYCNYFVEIREVP